MVDRVSRVTSCAIFGTFAMSFLDPFPFLERYGLQENPYSTKASERFLYIAPTHKEAIATIAKVVRDREGAVLIYGNYGTGKTSLMRRVYAEMRNELQLQVCLVGDGRNCRTEYELAEQIIVGFGQQTQSNSRSGRREQVMRLLKENWEKKVVSILVIDDAQEMPARVLRELRGYMNFETSQERLLQIVLFAQREIVSKKLPYAQAFRARLWRSELREMNRNELADMLRWRFQQAGGRTFPFEEPAIDHIFLLSSGSPLSAVMLAETALEVASYGSGTITADTIIKAKSKVFGERRNHE